MSVRRVESLLLCEEKERREKRRVRNLGWRNHGELRKT